MTKKEMKGLDHSGAKGCRAGLASGASSSRKIRLKVRNSRLLKTSSKSTK